MRDLARTVTASARRHPRTYDVVLAVLLAAGALVSVAAIYDAIRADPPPPPFRLPGMLATVLVMSGVSLPLAWRRRFPCWVLVVVVATYIVGQSVVEVPETQVSVIAGSVAIYSAAAYGHPRARTPVLALCLLAILAEVVRQLYFGPATTGFRPLLQGFIVAYNAVLLALPWGLGVAVRSSQERERELAHRAAELAREREENARQAVFAERVRIARELHDVVAHHVSVMGVQAGAARRVMNKAPEKAAQALSSIEISSRQAVVELHRLLGFLRRADEADDLAPQPDLARLADLVASDGVSRPMVEISIDGDPRPLSPTLEVSAFRIIQEALTNTRKHSAGATATVRVRYGEETLEVEVLDDGSGPAGRTKGNDGGLGLIGMRERVSLHGGHLSVGPRPEGGFGVHATFPLEGPDR